MRLHRALVRALLLVMALLPVPGLPWPASAQAPPPLGDTFDGPLIDRTKWIEPDFVRRVRNGAAELTLNRFGSDGSNSLLFTNPTAITAFQADVVVTAATATGTTPRARIRGRFFNDGAGAEVEADLALRFSGSSLAVTFSADRCTNADCSAFTNLVFNNTTLGTAALGTSHTLGISWDGGTTFTFGFDGATAARNTLSLGVANAGPPAEPFKLLGVRVSGIDMPSDVGFIAATFDNVVVNGAPYDDFASGRLDPLKWQTLELTRRAAGGVYESAIGRSGANGSNNLNLVQPAAVRVAADVTVTAVRNTGARPRARVFGAFYNDGTPGPIRRLGDILAGTEITHNGGGLRAGFFVSRCLAEACNLPDESATIIFNDTTFGPVELGATHRLSVAFNGVEFIFGFDGKTVTINPTAVAPVIGPPKVPFKGISTRVASIDTPLEGGFIAATFDNVLAEYVVPPAPVTLGPPLGGLGGQPGNGQSQNPAVSSDGRFVVIESAATNLVAAGCTTGLGQIFRQDRTAGTSTCVSVAPDGAPGNGGSGLPAVSGDGAVIAFQSAATNLVPGCASGVVQVYARALTSGTTACASVAPDGAPGNGANLGPELSADGRFVAFQSSATNLTPGCANGVSHVYRRDLTLGVTACASAGAGGAAGDAASSAPAISADGRLVAFQSSARNLVASGCTTGVSQIFLRDLLTGTTTCLGVATDGTVGNAASVTPSISADGNVVAFQSAARNLAAPCTTGVPQVFVRDRAEGTTTCVSVAADGTPGNGPSSDPAVSGSGAVVAFTSAATNLVPGATGGIAAGRAVVAQAATLTQVLKKNLTSVNSLVELMSQASGTPGNGASLKPALSFDGTVTVFQSTATNLAGGGTNGQADVFVVQPVVDPTARITFTAPDDASQFPLAAPTPVTFSWTTLTGVTRYAFEFTGPDRQFANPGGTAFDPVNGAGGAGGSLVVTGSSVTATLDPSFPRGVYQARVIGISPGGQLVGAFSDALTVALGPGVVVPSPSARVALTAPIEGARLARGTTATFGWTALSGILQYGLEFTGPDLAFANPNGAAPDAVNGFGGAGGGFPVAGTSLAVLLPATLPAGRYQVRVIGLTSAGQLFGTFSDAVTVVVE